MKGPALRLKFDVRRAWKCSLCGRIQRSPLERTTYRCQCTSAGTWMQLLDKIPTPPVYELSDAERACLTFSPVPQPGSQDSRNFESRRNSGSHRDGPRDDAGPTAPTHDSQLPDSQLRDPQLRDPRREDNGEQERAAELASPALASPEPASPEPTSVAPPVVVAHAEKPAANEDDFGVGVVPDDAAAGPTA